MKNIVENNKLIAEFLVNNEGGLVKLEENIFSTIDEFEIPDDYLTIKDLKYHKDWNWLMKVVEKIENLSKEGETYMFSITKFSARVTYKGSRIVDLPIDNTKIEAVYDACVEFIKWYNENKSK